MRRALLFPLSVWSLVASAAAGQEVCQTYRLVYQTVYDERQVTAFRIENETVYEPQQVTRYRPVYETEMRIAPLYGRPPGHRNLRARRALQGAASGLGNRNARRQLRPRPRRVRNVGTRRALHRSAAGLRNLRTRRALYRPAARVETQERRAVLDGRRTGHHLSHRLRRPRRALSNRPSSTRAAPTRLCVGFPAPVACDPATGAQITQRGGLAWVPFQGPARTEVQRVWQPNVVAQQTPQTTYVQRRLPSACPCK